MSLPKKIVLAVLCMVFLCAVLFSAIASRHELGTQCGGFPINLPDFKGYSFEECKQQYALYYDFKSVYEYSSEVPKGIVISQYPQPNTRHYEDTRLTIECTVSKGNPPKERLQGDD